MEILTSKIDKSVNFVEEQLTGFIESRYVRRSDDYFIAYVSSQTGCNRGCRFCHLTATKQMQFKDCTLEDFVEQSKLVFEHYDNQNVPAKWVNFNFMARGEPLANIPLLRDSVGILTEMSKLALERNLFPKFNISTIMPKTLRKPLTEVFPLITPTIYYSMYSCDEDFRNRWMPGAMPVDQALSNLKQYQSMTKKIVKMHGAFIAGENDSEEAVAQIIDAVKCHGLMVEWNIVRYNPFSPEQGSETPRLAEILNQLGENFPTKMISVVGRDVYASCGTFVGKSSDL